MVSPGFFERYTIDSGGGAGSRARRWGNVYSVCRDYNPLLLLLCSAFIFRAPRQRGEINRKGKKRLKGGKENNKQKQRERERRGKREKNQKGMEKQEKIEEERE